MLFAFFLWLIAALPLLGQAQLQDDGVKENPSTPIESTSNSLPSPPQITPDSEQTPEAPDIPQSLKPLLIKGGAGILVGLALGYTLRLFVRLALVMIGFVLGLFLLMAYAGWIDIHWEKLLHDSEGLIRAVTGQFSSFREFLNGALPPIVLAALGIALGFRLGKRS